MKYTRAYCFGGDHKAGDDDFVVAYNAENGKQITVTFCISNQSFRGYIVDGHGFSTLKAAKEYLEKNTGDGREVALSQKMLEELQTIADELHKARQEGDSLSEGYWQDVFHYSRKFVQNVTGKAVRINKWVVTIEEV